MGALLIEAMREINGTRSLGLTWIKYALYLRAYERKHPTQPDLHFP